ncbi:MAG: TAXI family TRAP transporter solute-binding subunit [Hyphomicrobiaceae bacterium]
MKHVLKSSFVAAAVLASSVPATAKDYVLMTASTGGTFHPVGVAISTMSKVKLQPKEKFSLTAVNSAGSGANLQAMASGNAEFSILQGLFGAYAAEGSGPFKKPLKNVRSIAMLWENVEHFVIANKYVKSGTVADILNAKGQPAGFGSKNSGTLGSNTELLTKLGLNLDKDFNLVYAGYGPTADALANGQIAVASIPSGPPAGAITKLMATNSGDVTLLSVTDEELKTMDGGRELWSRFVIPAGTYPNQKTDYQTIGQPNFLAVNADVPDEVVYKLTNAIFDNLPFLNAIHPATKAMSLEKAVVGLPLPLHPGALRYFREKGVNIPDRLVPKDGK